MDALDLSPDFLCLGEILIDWICPDRGVKLAQATNWRSAPGGAPANTAVGLARLGELAGFLGGLGDDPFGHNLLTLLRQEQVNTSGAVVIPGTQTRMAYVTTTADGDRELSAFSQVACADAAFGFDHLPFNLFKSAKVLHFGSISQIGPISSNAVEAAIQLAHDNDMVVSYDPNVRHKLWRRDDHCRSTILRTLGQTDVVKINRGELDFLTDHKGGSTEALAKQLRADHHIPLLLVTLDSHGAIAVHESGIYLDIPGYTVELVEATGAGDAFNAGVLSALHKLIQDNAASGLSRRRTVKDLSMVQIRELLRFANAVGALACSKIGAIPAMPTADEARSFLASQSH